MPATILDLGLPTKIFAPVFLVGTIFFLVAFGVSTWVAGSDDNGDYNAGLWAFCFKGKDNYEICGYFAESSDKEWINDLARSWFLGIQVIECLALIVMGAAIVTVAIFLFTKSKMALIVAAATSISSGILMILANAVYYTNFKDDDYINSTLSLDISWAFGFNIVGGILLIFSAVGMVLQIFLSRTSENRPQ